MSWPVLPVAARIQRGGWPFAVWLPLILLWPVILAVFGLALPMCVLVASPRRACFATVVATFQLLCALHGTTFELQEPAHGSWRIALY